MKARCPYCSTPDGKAIYTGLPGNACENCMNTGEIDVEHDCDLYDAGSYTNRQGAMRLIGTVVDRRNPPQFDDGTVVRTSPVDTPSPLEEGKVYTTRSGTRYCVHLGSYGDAQP